MTAQPAHDHSVTDRSLLSTKAYGTGQHLSARQSLYQWQTPRHDLPGIVVNQLKYVRGAVADVGCGNGKFVGRIRQERPDLTVLPMDVSHGIVTAIPGAIVADVQQLPIADGTLGAVLALHMLYHVENQPRAVRELGRVLSPDGIAIVSTNSRTDKRELEDLWRRAAGDVLGIEQGPARVQLSARFTLEDAPAILGTVFGDIHTIPLPGVIEVTDAEPVIAHLASYEAWADQMGVPFKETIERARDRVNEVIREEGAFRITCLGGILICQQPHTAAGRRDQRSA
ncbi:class I SAM-dependent methyltransferase [Streptomyces sp. NPDC127110]|uniref:class I SAM-dependent methyltransferase n=1 Tax=Streptomyces sp. NPDC127110 TaxID=3345362 RepID=UPI003624F68C